MIARVLQLNRRQRSVSRKRKIMQWKTLQTSLFSAAKPELRLFSYTKFREEGLCRFERNLITGSALCDGDLFSKQVFLV